MGGVGMGGVVFTCSAASVAFSCFFFFLSQCSAALVALRPQGCGFCLSGLARLERARRLRSGLNEHNTTECFPLHNTPQAQSQYKKAYKSSYGVSHCTTIWLNSHTTYGSRTETLHLLTLCRAFATAFRASGPCPVARPHWLHSRCHRHCLLQERQLVSSVRASQMDVPMPIRPRQCCHCHCS